SANMIVNKELAQRLYNNKHTSTNLDSGYESNTTFFFQSNLMILSQKKQNDLFGV
ncbi:14667_t:CDS:1, partial [Racocetra persica]